MMIALTRSARCALSASLFVLAVSSFAPAQAGPRPYAAHLTTTTTSVTQLSPTQVLITYVGTGHGTHLGNYQENGSYTVDLTTFTFVGSSTATAADGSSFSFSIFGGFTGPTTLAGTTSITGGTGRFAGATGALAFTGDQTTPINISADVAGWIQF